MKNKQSKKWHIGLNCTIGALALLGSIGTITFGTLWCNSRNQKVEVVQTIVVDQYYEILDATQWTNEALFYSKEKITFLPNTKYNFEINLSQLSDALGIGQTPTFLFQPNPIEEWDECGMIPLSADFDFAENQRHFYAIVNTGDYPFYSSIDLFDTADITYILETKPTITGYFVTADWEETSAPEPACAMFRCEFNKL